MTKRPQRARDPAQLSVRRADSRPRRQPDEALVGCHHPGFHSRWPRHLARPGHPSRVPVRRPTPEGQRSGLLADSVIMTAGGKQNWDNTHYLHWNYFGRRILWWDKWSGDVRIEVPAKKLLMLSNINTRIGKAFRNGVEITQTDSIAYFNDRAYKILINDSYWLVAPFKLKDPGVNLSYLGTAKDSANDECYMLQLTFNNVGVTPENKYHVWIDRKTYLMTQWAYYDKFSDDTDILTSIFNFVEPTMKILISDLIMVRHILKYNELYIKFNIIVGIII
jgi:hypothetical protein